MIATFERFRELLEDRFARGVITTEDSVRYTFFAALIENGTKPHEVVLEYPHPAINRARIDTLVPDEDGASVSLEFKYDRDLPGGNNQPKTQKAGYVFNDLRRQVSVARGLQVRSYFVYVTSEEMAVYFRNHNNSHERLWNLDPRYELRINGSYFEGKPKSFIKAAGGPFDAVVTGVCRRELSGGNHLRIYEVRPGEY